MTRAHARLLGPCFKTGPVSARNKTTADRDASRPRDEPDTQPDVRFRERHHRARDPRRRKAPRPGRGATPTRHGRQDDTAKCRRVGGREPRSLPSPCDRDANRSAARPRTNEQRDNDTTRSIAIVKRRRVAVLY
jgi:hypothetical protein